MTINTNFLKKFENNFSYNVNLSNYSWFNLGGNAEYFLKAKDKSQLIEFLREAKKNNLKTTILGAGSNTLFRDNGVKGAVIKLGNEFSYTKLVNKNIIDVGGSTLDRKVANFAKENNIESPILDAVIKRNEEIDRPEQDWKADKGRAVAED